MTNGHTNGNGTHTEAEHPLANGDGAAPQVNGQEEDADAETKPNGQAEAEEEEGATTGETKEGATTADQDVVLIQDTGFNIKIQAPGMDPFDLPVSLSSLFDCYLFGLCFNAKINGVPQNLPPPRFLGNLPMWRFFFIEKFKFYLLGDILRGYLKVKSEKIVFIILTHTSLSICTCKFTEHYIIVLTIGLCMVLASRASGCLFGHPNPQKAPIRTPKFFWEDFFLNVNLKHIIEYFHHHIIPMTLHKDIMPYFDKYIYMFMVEIWGYCGPP